MAQRNCSMEDMSHRSLVLRWGKIDRVRSAIALQIKETAPIEHFFRCYRCPASANQGNSTNRTRLPVLPLPSLGAARISLGATHRLRRLSCFYFADLGALSLLTKLSLDGLQVLQRRFVPITRPGHAELIVTDMAASRRTSDGKPTQRSPVYMLCIIRTAQGTWRLAPPQMPQRRVAAKSLNTKEE